MDLKEIGYGILDWIQLDLEEAVWWLDRYSMSHLSIIHNYFK
jgi:hypothetical protein